MKIEIKSRIDLKVLFSCEAKDMKEAVLKAIKEKVNLRFADLSSADLSFADLRSAKGIFTFNFGVKIKVVRA